MEEIHWAKAPEGTTHFVMGGHGQTPWRKITENKVYQWRNKMWDDRVVSTVAEYLRTNHDLLVAKPVEAVLPHGLEWSEGYDYYNPCGGMGFFFNERAFNWRGEAQNWNVEFNYWKNHEDTIRRYGEGAVARVEVAEQPVPKKKAGWWD